MSRRVLPRKRGTEHEVQAWNMKELPDELSQPPEPWVSRNPADKLRPWTLLFNPGSWTQIPRQPAPQRDRKLGSTLDVPDFPLDSNGGTK